MSNVDTFAITNSGLTPATCLGGPPLESFLMAVKETHPANRLGLRWNSGGSDSYCAGWQLHQSLRLTDRGEVDEFDGSINFLSLNVHDTIVTMRLRALQG